MKSGACRLPEDYLPGFIGVEVISILGRFGFLGFFFSFRPLSFDFPIINLLNIIYHFDRSILLKPKRLVYATLLYQKPTSGYGLSTRTYYQSW